MKIRSSDVVYDSHDVKLSAKNAMWKNRSQTNDFAVMVFEDLVDEDRILIKNILTRVCWCRLLDLVIIQENTPIISGACNVTKELRRIKMVSLDNGSIKN